jgi:predicted nucleic acid-binding protein
MAATGILDTSTLIIVDRLAPGELPTEPIITAITLAELTIGPLVTDDETERTRRQTRLQSAESTFDRPLPFDASAARAFAGVALSLRRAGRKATARSFDALIAATAIANRLPVYTCNPKDFDGIDGLTVVAVPYPG